MPTVEQIEVSYRSQIASPAQADAAALDAVADGLNKVADSVEVTDEKIQRSTKSGVGFRNSLDTVTKSANALQNAQNKLAEVTQAVSDSVRRGEITQAEAARTIDAQAAKVQKLTQAHEAAVQSSKGATAAVAETTETARMSSQQMGILADEAHKFFDQVMSGGSALQAAFYQVPNMVQVMGGFGSAIEMVTGFLVGPAGLALAGAAAAAAVYKVGASAESEQEQLATLSQHLRATRDDYTAMASAAEVAARQLSAGSGLSLDDSRSVTTTFAAVPTIDSSSLTYLSQEARDLAEVMGETVPEAAKEMADAYADPAKAAQDFADKGLLGVHQGLVTQVKDLQDSGNRMQAWQLLMQQLGSATQGATDQGLTPFQQALRNLKDSWDGPIQGAKQLTSAIGDGIVAAATKGINALASMGSSLQSVKKWMDSFQPDHVAYETRQQQIQQGSSSGMSGLIDTVGQQIGATSDVISLAHRIQPVESSTGQYDRTGAVVTSSAGAIGGMQVMPSNADGNDLTDPTGNVTAAERLLVRLYSKYSGNEQLVAMAYNWGEGNVDKYLQGQASVPQSVQDYAQKVTGGQTYGATTTAAMQGKVDDALKTSDSSTASQVTDQTNAIKQLMSAQEALDTLHKAGAVSDSDYAARTQDLTQRLMAHKGALNDLRDPMQELAHQQQQATDAAWAGTAAQKAMVQVDQQVEEAARKMGQSHATAAQVLQAEANEQQVLTGEFNSSIETMDRKTAAQNTLLSSYDASKGSLDDYLRSVEASDTVQATSVAGTQEQARQTAVLTDALKRQAEAQADITTARKEYSQSLDLETIKAETEAVGQDSDAVSVQMAVLKERNALLENGADLTSKASQADLDNVAAIQTATNAYQKQQDTLNELTSDISSAADTLSSSFTQALVNASNGGVTFKSAMQGVESQIISLVAKLTLINPLLTAIDGKSRTTLGDVSSILSGASSSGVTSENAISAYSGGWGWNPVSSAGSSTSSASSLGGSTSWLSSGLKTNLFGTATVGNSIAGIGGGMALGSSIGSMINRKHKTGSTVGSAVGSAAGAAIGSIIPGVGTIIGGLIGGLIGGGAGSLFGGHAKNPYTIDQVMTTGGSLSLGKTWNQAQTDEITAQLKSDIASFNSVLSATGVTIGGGDGGLLGTVRDDKNNKDKSLQSVSLTDLLKQATYSTSDATFQQALQQGLPSNATSVSDYATAIENLKTMADTVEKLGVSVSKFNSDGTVTVDKISGYSGDLADAVNTLDGKTIDASSLQDAISSITSAWSQIEDNAKSVQARYLAATGDQEGSDLLTFDQSADQQREQLKEAYENIWGDAYATQKNYVQQSADLEKTLAAERLKIQQQYTDQAASSVSSVISSLTSYAQGLAFSDASPLSAQDQYAAANDNFTTDLAAAKSGDFTALQNLQGYASTLLSTSQAWNGSGQGYVTDYQRVMQALQDVGNTSSASLISSEMKAALQSQTDVLAGLLQQLVTLGGKNLSELKLTNLKSTIQKAA